MTIEEGEKLAKDVRGMLRKMGFKVHTGSKLDEEEEKEDEERQNTS